MHERASVVRAKKVATVSFTLFLVFFVLTFVAIPVSMAYGVVTIFILPLLLTILTWFIPSAVLPDGYGMSVTIQGKGIHVEAVSMNEIEADSTDPEEKPAATSAE